MTAYRLTADRPTIVGISSGEGTAAGSISVPAGVQARDILIFFGQSNVSIDPPGAGWHSLPGTSLMPGYYKVSDGTETSVAVNVDSLASNHWVAAVVAITGAEAPSSAPNGGAGFGFSLSGNNVSSTAPDSLFVALATMASQASFTGGDFATISGDVEQLDVATALGSGGAIGVWTASRTSIGSAGAFSASATNFGTWYVRTFALSPVKTFAIAGGSVTFSIARRMAAAVGSFSIAGSVGMPIARMMAAAAGALGITGSDSRLVRGVRLGVSAASYAVTASSAALHSARHMTTSTGALAVNGASVALRHGRRLAAAAASYAIAGTVVKFSRGRRLVASTRAVAISGATTGLRSARKMAADAAAFVVNVAAAALNLFRPVSTPGSRRVHLTGNKAERTAQISGGGSRHIVLTGGKAERSVQLEE